MEGRVHRVSHWLFSAHDATKRIVPRHPFFSYDTLKKCTYQLEKQQHGQEPLGYHDLESNEQTSLVGPVDQTDAIFVPLLDKELKKIELFYEHQEKEVLEDLAELQEHVEEQEQLGLAAGERYMDDPADDDDDDDDDSISRSPISTRRRQRKSSSVGVRNRVPGLGE